MAEGNRIFRIGTGAGFAADRLDAAVELAQRGKLDVMVLECLGERTVAFAHRDRLADPRRGYNHLLERRMRALLPVCHAAGTTIITNMGAANPRAAAEHTQEIARDLGIAGLKIACIEGDDVSGLLSADQPFMDEPGTIAAIKHRIVGMNAYLGADAIVPALDAGADVVIGGRLADPSMYLAPLKRHFGWKNSDMGALAAGTLVGHLMECGMQITGGYFADPGIKDVPDLARCGYPIAEVSADGSAVITKLPDTGGFVTAATVKEQLLYEVHDPANYLTPDVTADFSRVEIKDHGFNRVRVSDAAGHARPEHLKVTVGFDAGVLAEAGVSYAGPSASARGRLAADIVEARLKNTHGLESDLRIDLIGASSLFATAGKVNTDSEDVRLHVATRTTNREEAELLLWEVEALLCCGPAGGGGFRGVISPAIMTKSVLIDRTLVHPTFEMFGT
jgi:acyclic terpene utilization AtuA family protein